MTAVLVFCATLMVTGATCFAVGWAIGNQARRRDALWRGLFERTLEARPVGEQPTRELPRVGRMR